MIHLSRRIPAKRLRQIKQVRKGIAYFSRSSDIGRMNSGTERSNAVEGLRLIRAFLSLPPDKRAEVIAFVEGLARAQDRPAESAQASPK
jgi:hypothetical protein